MPERAAHIPSAANSGLGDFRTDGRVLMLAAMAIAIGALATLGAAGLVRLIALVGNLVWLGRFSTAPIVFAHVVRSPWMLAAPAVGGLVIGLMARFGSEKIRGHGIPEAIEAILIGGSRMSLKVAILKPISSAISIGTGGPFGAEGPIIMTGGAIGSLFAQAFHLSAAERKTLLVAGAAAGMTAIFGTPVAAVLLAVELLLFEWRPRSFIPVVAAAITATCLRPLMFGSGPLFHLVEAPPLTAWGLVAGAGVGVLIGLQSGLFTKLLYLLEDGFEHLPVHWMWWPAIGGLIVGAGGLIEPRALGVGYDVISDLLGAPLVVQAVLAILLVKAGIWLVALSSGTSGGVLAPLLILGGAAGWLIGHFFLGTPGYFALIGMAAMLGGTMRSPLTGAIFALELTGDLSILPALLAASTAAYAVTVLLLKRSILTEKIARRGQHISREYGVDPFELARVAEIMVSKVDVLHANLPIARAIEVMAAGAHRIYPVLDDKSRPIGMVSRADALRWSMESDHGSDRIVDRISDADLPHVYPDQVVARAIEVMIETDQGRLPVIDRQSGALVGLLTRKTLLKVRAGAARGEQERRAYIGPSAKLGLNSAG